MINVSVIGATGYVGVELIRILQAHPKVQIVGIASQSHNGKSLQEVYPHLDSIVDIDCTSDVREMVKKTDVVFTALPPGIAMNYAEIVLDTGKILIDLGSDFRLKNASVYKKWYGSTAASSKLLHMATYSIPEITDHNKIKKSKLIANPGCYPTCALLAAMPVCMFGIVKTSGIVFDAKSGISGAGRKTLLESNYCEVAENSKAYSISGTHRHVPEIEQGLSEVFGKEVVVQFTPHILPMIRGLLVTTYFTLKKNLSEKEIWDAYARNYKDKPFIRLCPLGTLPQTANVRGSNYCDIGLKLDSRTGRLLVISVIDNLIKGAAGQAIQNMNLLFDYPEAIGLDQCPVYP